MRNSDIFVFPSIERDFHWFVPRPLEVVVSRLSPSGHGSLRHMENALVHASETLMHSPSTSLCLREPRAAEQAAGRLPRHGTRHDVDRSGERLLEAYREAIAAKGAAHKCYGLKRVSQ